MAPPPLPDKRPSNSRKSISNPTRVLEQIEAGQTLGAAPPGAAYAGLMGGSNDGSKPPAGKARRASVSTYASGAGLAQALPQRVPQAYGEGPEMQYGQQAYAQTPGPAGYAGAQLQQSGGGSSASSSGGGAPLGTRSSAGSAGGQDLAGPQPPRTVPKIVSALLSGPKPWNEKVRCMAEILAA